jgi:tetratricopeptide (TPR) repeat protein
MNTITRREFIIYSFQLLVLAKMTGCRPSSPVLGKMPIPNPLIIEDHSQALAHWAEHGIRDAVLVNIDTHDDFRWIPDNKVNDLKNIYRRRDWNRFNEADSVSEQGLYHLGNWIYAGERLGIIKEIFWIIPFSHFSQKNPEKSLRQWLQTTTLASENYNKFYFSNNRLHCSFNGIQITICGLESLPDINKPILLSLDIDYFPTYTSQYNVSFLEAVHTTFDALYKKNYQILDTALCYSVDGDYLHPHHRWVGDMVVTFLNKPNMFHEPPSELLRILDLCEFNYREKNVSQLLTLTEFTAAKYQTPAVLLYNAYAYMLQGNITKAYDSALASCKANILYCTGMAYIGMYFCKQGQYQKAEKFFSGAVSINPKMHYGLFEYGVCLRELGKLREAIICFDKDESIDGSFTPEFMIFETYLMLGNHQAALAVLKVAIGNMERDAYARVLNPLEAHAIYVAIDFCDQNGLKDFANRLRINPAVVEMFDAFPRNPN